MKTSRFWGYFGKVGLGAGVAVALGGAPIVAHADDMPSHAIESGSQATSKAASDVGNAAGNAADKAGSAASGAAEKAGDEASGAADKANSATTGAADKAAGMSDDSSITDAVKGKLTKAGNDMNDIKVDTDNGIVTLSGTVHQQSTREQAVKMAKKAKGVKSVKDDIEILPAK